MINDDTIRMIEIESIMMNGDVNLVLIDTYNQKIKNLEEEWEASIKLRDKICCTTNEDY